MALRLICAVLVFLTACSAMNQSPSRPAPVEEIETPSGKVPLFPSKDALPGTFQETTCRFTLSEEIEGVTCGFLTVPERRDLENSRLIQLHIAILRPHGGIVTPDPVIFLSGGPGYSILEELASQYNALTRTVFLTGRELVVFDQRGIGLSSPALDCPEFDQLTVELMDREFEGHPVSTDEAINLSIASLRDCRDKLTQTADLSAYHSAASADDVEDLRQALGYTEVNLWGGSYGSRLALEVMRRHPEGLRSVVLDAVYPPSVDLFLDGPANFQRALDKMFASCEANPVCQGNFPDLERVYFETVERLSTNPVLRENENFITGQTIPRLLDGNAFQGTTFRLLYDSTWRYALPKQIYAASRGDYADFDLVHSAFLTQMDLSSRGMMFSVLCHEEMPFSTLDDYQEALEKYPNIKAMYKASILGDLAYQVCPIWGAGKAGPTANQPVDSEIPTLLMSGEYDPITPPAWGETAAKTLSNAVHITFPGIGHGASGVIGCPQSILQVFWENPASPIDTACVAEMSVQ